MITPQDVTDYSVFQVVKDRDPDLLTYDILQAETEICEIVGHEFDPVEYPTIPATVRLATIKLTEYYALVNTDESRVKGIKSEKIGDYSYQTSESGEVKTVSLLPLLQKYIKTTAVKTGNRFRMRTI